MSLLFISCEGIDNQGTDGSDSYESDWVVPSSARAGGEMIVQWDGFTASAVLYLGQAQTGARHELEMKALTASGVILGIPHSVPAGRYMLVLEQDGQTHELAQVDVLDALAPVTGISVPSGVTAGEEFLISGLGFNSSSAVFAGDQDGNMEELHSVLSAGMLIVTVPADMPEGSYSLYLQQDGGLWLIASTFNIYAVSVEERKLSGIDYYTPYVGTAMLKTSWDISMEEPLTLTLSESYVSGDETTLNAYDRYVCDESGYFDLTEDGRERTNTTGVSYQRDDDGRVSVSDVLLYGDEDLTRFMWEYDAQGNLTTIYSPKNVFRAMEYENGNLTSCRGVSFEYGDKSLVNAPDGPDIAWSYMCVNDISESFVYFPYLIGWNGKVSVNLPTAIYIPDPFGAEALRYGISYDYDDSGYVIKASWGSESLNFRY